MGVETVKIQTIASKLARDYKGLDFDINEIGEWCFEVVKEIGDYDYFNEVYGEVLEAKNKKWKLPCGIYRLLEVFPMHNLSVYNASGDRFKTRFHNDGTYLRFQNDLSGLIKKDFPQDGTKISIDYLGYEMDENGFPLIPDTAQDACFWYCVMKLKLEDFLNGKFQGYPYVESQYDKAISSARSSMRGTTRNDMNDINRAKYNTIPKLRSPR